MQLNYISTFRATVAVASIVNGTHKSVRVCMYAHTYTYVYLENTHSHITIVYQYQCAVVYRLANAAGFYVLQVI